MRITPVLPFARELLMKCIPENGVAVDATAGNGNDTVFLGKLVWEKGTVYSFDIQMKAIEATKEKVKLENLDNQVNIIHDGHENLHRYLKNEHHHQVDGAIFNLGYLPGSDKSIVTTPETTLSALSQLTENIKRKGIIVLVVYYGHEEGKREKDALLLFVRDKLPQESFHVLEYRFTNQRNHPPFIIAIEKR